MYFEMDQSGQLNEYTERKEMSADVQCMALGPIPHGELRSRFLAIGLSDNTVRIISLDPQVKDIKCICDQGVFCTIVLPTTLYCYSVIAMMSDYKTFKIVIMG